MPSKFSLDMVQTTNLLASGLMHEFSSRLEAHLREEADRIVRQIARETAESLVSRVDTCYSHQDGRMMVKVVFDKKEVKT